MSLETAWGGVGSVYGVRATALCAPDISNAIELSGETISYTPTSDGWIYIYGSNDAVGQVIAGIQVNDLWHSLVNIGANAYNEAVCAYVEKGQTVLLHHLANTTQIKFCPIKS